MADTGRLTFIVKDKSLYGRLVCQADVGDLDPLLLEFGGNFCLANDGNDVAWLNGSASLGREKLADDGTTTEHHLD